MRTCFWGDVAQLVRALPCHGRGRGFEPRRPRQYPLATPIPYPPIYSTRSRIAYGSTRRGRDDALHIPGPEHFFVSFQSPQAKPALRAYPQIFPHHPLPITPANPDRAAGEPIVPGPHRPKWRQPLLPGQLQTPAQCLKQAGEHFAHLDQGGAASGSGRRVPPLSRKTGLRRTGTPRRSLGQARRFHHGSRGTVQSCFREVRRRHVHV